jgi:hypothetical protein
MSGWGKRICAVILSLDMVIARLGPNRMLNKHPEFSLMIGRTPNDWMFIDKTQFLLLTGFAHIFT